MLHRNRNVQCCHKEFTSSQGTERSDSKQLAGGTWGHDVQMCGCGDPGHLAAVQQGPWRCSGCRLAWRSRIADQRTSLTDWWKLLEQGPEKSGCFSDLLWWRVGLHGLLRFDADTFFGAGAFAYPSSCSLPQQAVPRRVRTACLCWVRSTHSESRASTASNATPIRTATTNGRTSTSSWRVRRQLEHRRLPGIAANPKAIEPSAFWCGGRSNGSRFNCAQHVAVLGVDDPVGVRSHQ